MHTEPDSRHSPVYRIMIHMGYSDMIQLLLSGTLSSFYSLFYSKKFFLINKFFSGLAEASWFSYLALSQLLAVNRVFWVFAGEDKVKSWFSMHQTQIYIFVCWIPGVLYTVLLALPNVDFIYMVDIGTFGPIYSPTIEIFFVVNLVIDITHSVSEILWYALIYLKIKFQGHTNVNLLIYKLCYIFTNVTWFLCAGNNILVYLLFNLNTRTNETNFVFWGQGFDIDRNKKIEKGHIAKKLKKQKKKTKKQQKIEETEKENKKNKETGKEKKKNKREEKRKKLKTSKIRNSETISDPLNFQHENLHET
uniref:Uncharacterized protein n=1 Tax=Romanomermis culicivorax TaxID=13658 RepID=A0A915HLW5_ROMCU